ncbi:MAG: helix-turn-helix domain-containing protein [Gemmatimonadota bacterium]
MRVKNPDRLAAIATAATDEFISHGYTLAKVHDIARAASISAGTVYLYAADKGALFELALRRALGDPTVERPPLPFRRATGKKLLEILTTSLSEIAHFPHLWLACERRDVEDAAEEYDGILREIARWLLRYRQAVLLIERNRNDWPDAHMLFYEHVWFELHRRLAQYLDARIRATYLAPISDPYLLARFVLDGLAGFLVIGPIGTGSGDDEAALETFIAQLLGRASLPLGHGGPLPA